MPKILVFAKVGSQICKIINSYSRIGEQPFQMLPKYQNFLSILFTLVKWLFQNLRNQSYKSCNSWQQMPTSTIQPTYIPTHGSWDEQSKISQKLAEHRVANCKGLLKMAILGLFYIYFWSFKQPIPILQQIM